MVQDILKIRVTYFAQILLSKVESLHFVVVLLLLLLLYEHLHNQDWIVQGQILQQKLTGVKIMAQNTIIRTQSDLG